MKKLGLVVLFWIGFALAWAQAQVPFSVPISTSPQMVPLSNSTSGTTGAITATLTGVTSKWTYLCGFVVTSAGTTPVVSVTLGVTGATSFHEYIYDFVNPGQGLLGIAYPGCLVSSAQGGSISVSLPASGGTGTQGAIDTGGYAN